MIRRGASVVRASILSRSVLRAAPRAAPLLARRGFAFTAQRCDALSDSASELVNALRAEQKLELESAEDVKEESSEFMQWLDKSKYEVVVADGNEQVQLVKKVSPTETVRVFFSISDVVNAETLLDEDPLSTSEEVDEHGELDEGEGETPIRVNIVVERPNGALGIEGVVQDDMVLVESLIPYADAKLALDESAEADYLRGQTYQGPPFTVLDPSVQSAVQQYLDARGLDGDFALFVQEYASFRENKEYASWLGKIAKIVE